MQEALRVAAHLHIILVQDGNQVFDQAEGSFVKVLYIFVWYNKV